MSYFAPDASHALRAFAFLGVVAGGVAEHSGRCGLHVGRVVHVPVEPQRWLAGSMSFSRLDANAALQGVRSRTGALDRGVGAWEGLGGAGVRGVPDASDPDAGAGRHAQGEFPELAPRSLPRAERRPLRACSRRLSPRILPTAPIRAGGTPARRNALAALCRRRCAPIAGRPVRPSVARLTRRLRSGARRRCGEGAPGPGRFAGAQPAGAGRLRRPRRSGMRLTCRIVFG